MAHHVEKNQCHWLVTTSDFFGIYIWTEHSNMVSIFYSNFKISTTKLQVQICNTTYGDKQDKTTFLKSYNTCLQENKVITQWDMFTRKT